MYTILQTCLIVTNSIAVIWLIYMQYVIYTENCKKCGVIV